MKKIMFLVAFIAMAVFALSPAGADYTDFKIYPFCKLETNTTVPGTPFTLTIGKVDDTHVDFVISYAAGTDYGVITSVYIYDGVLGAGTIVDSPPDVDFTTGSGSVPGGDPIGLNVSPSSAFFVADRATPPSEKGIDPGESLKISFSGTYSDVISGLDKWLALSTTQKHDVNWNTNPDNYIAAAFHLQSIPSTYVKTSDSDSFVVCVPLPGAVLLLGAGLVRLVAYARRRED